MFWVETLDGANVKFLPISFLNPKTKFVNAQQRFADE